MNKDCLIEAVSFNLNKNEVKFSAYYLIGNFCKIKFLLAAQ